MAVRLSGDPIRLSDFFRVAQQGEKVLLVPAAVPKMERSRRLVEAAIARGEIIYGVTTGLGKLSDRTITPEAIRRLQLNTVRSHACGIGPPLDKDETRGILFLRAHVLSMGYSGVRPVVVKTLLEMLNRNILPSIPSRGSVGASGDLIPLAHVALAMIGEGRSAAAMKQAGIRPLTLEAKEGIALVNGTQASLALALLLLRRAERIADAADLAAALSLEALKGTPTAFDKRIHDLRRHPGQVRVAANLRDLLAGSEIRRSHVRADPRVQDAYSLRCVPQVHGPVRDALSFIRRILETEINSVTDNPLVFAQTGEILAGGNFHGHPLALALDLLAIAMTHLAGISERRIERLTNPDYGELPPFLAREPGTQSGMMMPQVAAAALASENKVLSHPASVDSIPTSGNREDYVSMSMGAALKAKQVVQNTENILAIELLAASRGIEFHRPLRSGKKIESALREIRKIAPDDLEDRPRSEEIERLRALISSGVLSSLLLQPAVRE